MKTIPDELKTDIEDAATAGLLGNLPAAAAEKDQHITDALRALAVLRLEHLAHLKERRKADTRPPSVAVATHLVFAGGTCLSKAHTLIERMSEDIDIKVVLEPIPEGYALDKGMSDRTRLRQLHSAVEDCLSRLGFEHAFIEGDDNPIARDNRRYYCLAVSYAARFQDVSGALRPQLKIELIHRPPMLAVETRELGYLLDQLISRTAPQRFSMPCITVAETLAEKVLSLLRRCAWHWDGHRHAPMDAALVRHIYDVWRIAQSQPDAVKPACQMFAALVAKEAQEFNGQHPEFDKDPYMVLRRTLAQTAARDDFHDHFERRLKPLLYAGHKPDFLTCYAAFSDVAKRLLAEAG